ncbi:MAG: RNA-binding transcriptional accessory protein, partial [Tardiphaga sp.]|nr:RNA-binding transcriptional accessory protein [Tardiphaga sp.]
GPKADRPQQDRGPRVNERQSMSSSAPRKPGEAAPGGAFAEALRRAAEKGAGKAK